MADNSLVYVALDYDSQQKNIEFATRLAESVDSDRFGFKINLDSVADFSSTALNPYSIVKLVMGLGRSVFVDMKMWNGGRTMRNIAEGCAALDVDLINMYPHAGMKFMEGTVRVLEGTNTKLFGLTVLTHYTDEDTRKLYGKSLSGTVRMFAEMGRDYGAHGIVVPGTQLDVVEDLDFLKLCPGVRPEWFEDKKANAQEQIVTPTDGVRGGANFLVVGSPIRKSSNPSRALEKIIEEIS